jgi:lytic cellulose monooxygenase (C1-hydroxylating)
MIDYLANCNGPCETVDKTTLKWFKIDALGLINPTGMTDGYWASDVMIANNNSWTVQIPSTIAQGNYVVRHETIALHAASSANGAQNYPFCFNLAITSSGSDNPAGVLGTALYKETDPGIIYDIYQNTLATYTIPGPALYSSAVSLTQTLPPKPTATGKGVANVKRAFQA